MKVVILIALLFVLLGMDCGGGNGSENPVRSDIDRGEIAASPNQLSVPRKTPEPKSDRLCFSRPCRIDILIDEELESRLFYRDGHRVREVVYDTSTKEPTTEIKYFYDKNGKFVRQKLIRGKDYDNSEDAALERSHAEKEFDFQYKHLQSMGISFPMPDLAVDEVLDLSVILNLIQAHSDKVAALGDGNRLTMKLAGLNENVYFKPSILTMFVGDNPIPMKEVEVTLRNSLPIEELITTGNGVLTIKFSYADENLKTILYQFTDSDGQVSRLSREFRYQAP